MYFGLFNTLLCAFTIIIPTIQAESPFKPLQNWFSGITEQTYYKELNSSAIKTLVIDNPYGRVSIKAWPVNKIVIQACKSAPEKKLAGLSIDVQVNSGQELLNITTKNASKKKQGTVDYKIMIPYNVNVSVSARDTVKIKHVEGTVNVTAHKGSIIITNSTNNVAAYAPEGSLTISSKQLPTHGKLTLSTQNGAITIAIPVNTNATIDAASEQGCVLSDHYITLKPQTVKLNQATWDFCKHNVLGTMGTGAATITARSIKGTITFTEY